MKTNVRVSKSSLGLLILGLVLGAVAISPAAGHVGGTVSHLWSDHIKGKVQSLGDTRWAADNHNHDSRYPRYGGTLPPGESTTGVWSVGYQVPGYSYVFNSITFEVPLNFNPTVRLVPAGPEPPEECSGSPAAPEADPGYLCFYVTDARDWSGSLVAYSPDQPYFTGSCNDTELPEGTALCRNGVLIRAGQNPNGADGRTIVYGTYVVTAPLDS